MLTQCENTGEQPRSPAADAGSGQTSADCCVVAPRAGLKDGIGRVVVSYPGDGASLTARLDIYKAGEPGDPIAGGYGNQAIELLPGTYDVEISGKQVAHAGASARSPWLRVLAMDPGHDSV